MRTEGRIIRGFIMAEPGVSYQLKGKVSGLVMKDAAVKLSDLKNQFLKQ